MNIPKPLRDDSNGAVLSGRHYAGTYYGVYSPTTLDMLDDAVDLGTYYRDMPTRRYGKCLGIFSDLREATDFALELGGVQIYKMGWTELQTKIRWVCPKAK